MITNFCLSIDFMQRVSVGTILRSQDAGRLFGYASMLNMRADSHSMMPFGLVQDGRMFKDRPYRQYLSGEGRHDIPIMVGSLQHEATFFFDGDNDRGPLSSWWYPLIVSAVFGPFQIRKVMSLYPILPEDAGDLRGPLARLATSWIFACGANEIARKSPQNVFYYFFTHAPVCSRWATACTTKSCHNDDVGILFNSTHLKCTELTASEAQLGLEWRHRIWKMVDGGDPWPHPRPNGATGVEILVGKWDPVTFDTSSHACAFLDGYP